MDCFPDARRMENRNGLIVQAQVTQADGRAERKAALKMIHRHSPGLTRRLTPGADKGYDSADFVADLQQASVTPHVARKSRHSAIAGRTTRHPGYAVSQRRRKKIEEPFGWAKTLGNLAQTMLRGVNRLSAQFIRNHAAQAVVRRLFALRMRRANAMAGALAVVILSGRAFWRGHRRARLAGRCRSSLR